MRSMRNSNLEIRIAGSSCRPQLTDLKTPCSACVQTLVPRIHEKSKCKMELKTFDSFLRAAPRKYQLDVEIVKK